MKWFWLSGIYLSFVIFAGMIHLLVTGADGMRVAVMALSSSQLLLLAGPEYRRAKEASKQVQLEATVGAILKSTEVLP